MNIDRIVTRLLSRNASAPAAEHDDERVKRLFLSVCLAFMVPVALIFGIRDLFNDRQIEGVVVVGIGVILSILTILLNRSRHHAKAIRIFICLLSSCLFYELYIGGGGGAALLWFFVMPPSIIFLLGLREGIIWTGGMAVIISTLLYGGFGHHYPIDFVIRIVSVFTVITLLACCLEILREHYLRQLKAEKEALSRALAEIKQLKGMVPICASCKKIRNDDGFWTQIETFIKEHADVEFSHGICPECAVQHFPKATRARAVEQHIGTMI